MTVASRLKAAKTDWGLLVVVLALLVIGMVMIYSASYGFSLIKGGDYEGLPAHFVKRQAIFAALGLVVMIVFANIDYHLYQRYAVWILGGTIGVLVLTFILLAFQEESLGRWIFAKSRSVQPSEVAKLGAMIYIAVWLAARGQSLRSIKLGLVPFLLMLGFIAGLIMLQPDFSTAVLLVATAAAMFFVAGADMKQLLLGVVVGGGVLVLMAIAFRYRMERISIWLEKPWNDASGKGYQLVQTLIAVNRGQLFGVGLGQSQQKFMIYAPHSDCIFAIIAEELGLLGSILVLIVYGLWAWRGLRIGWHAGDLYGKLLAVGLTAWVTLQAILHVAVNTDTTPFTGTVLPFISAGGSSLVSGLAAVGILLNIARQSHGVAQGENA